MHPYLFGSLPTYLVAYLGGITLFLVLSLVEGARLNIPVRDRLVASVSYGLGMVVGAKVLYDLQNGGFRSEIFYSVEHYLRGGIWGGALAFLALAVPYGLLLHGSRGRYFDMIALTLPLPLALAKLGCAGVGCCYGTACTRPWAVHLEPNEFNHVVPEGTVHPTQLYDFAALMGTAFFVRVMKRQSPAGHSLPWFLTAFGLTRFLTEFLRGDSDSVTGTPLTAVQWLCIPAVVGALVFLGASRRRPTNG